VLIISLVHYANSVDDALKNGTKNTKNILRAALQGGTIDKKRPDRFCSKLGSPHEKIQIDLWWRQKRGGASHFWAHNVHVKMVIWLAQSQCYGKGRKKLIWGCQGYLLKNWHCINVGALWITIKKTKPHWMDSFVDVSCVASCWWSIQNATAFIMLENHSWAGILQVRASSDVAGKHQAGKSEQPCLLRHQSRFSLRLFNNRTLFWIIAFERWRLDSEQVVTYTPWEPWTKLFLLFLSLLSLSA